MKVSQQVIHTDLHEKAFAESTLTILNLNAISNFHIKKCHEHVKYVKTIKLFCLKTFMVYVQ